MLRLPAWLTYMLFGITTRVSRDYGSSSMEESLPLRRLHHRCSAKLIWQHGRGGKANRYKAMVYGLASMEEYPTRPS